MKLYKNAVIFAGGKSSRMGKDKALLPFGAYKSLSHFQFDKLQKLFTHVYLSAKNDKFDFEAPVIKDKYSEDSPLVGLLSIFESLEVEEVFILSVDAPFVDASVIAKLMAERTEPYDAIVAKSPSGLQPLCGAYNRSILPLVREQYEKGDHKLMNLLSLVHTITVDFEDDTPFTNLNHPEEYEEACLTLADKKA
ncbi:MAG: molybdenum cofactor guanylyltransferase MobA [Sulfurovum sp.]|nr:molybdenum cofactor guanylyltransferase MobA [Sulfurovum sp.]